MAKKDKFIASPLFDAHKTFVRLPMGLSMLAEYPDSKQFLESISHSIPEAQQDFIHTQAFLKSYSRKSEATYRSYRNEVLDCYLFNNLNEVNMLTEDWIKVYNNERPHDSLNDMTPAEYRQVA